MWWTLDRTTSSNVFRLECKFDKQPRRLCLLSDIHWDSAKCRLDLFKKTLDEAKEDQSPVVITGDFFDAMQGKWDPRASQSAMRPEHQTDCYLDSLVNTAADWLEPYADIISLISEGNHETAIKKRHQVDLLQRLCHELRNRGSRVACGPYMGFLHVVGKHQKFAKQQDSFTIHYHHGSGGGGEVSRGISDWSRTRSMYLADVYVSGHIHRRNMDENVLTALTSKGYMRYRKQLFLRASCFKDESSDGWHVQQGRGARPIGGWWLEMAMASHNNNYQITYRAIPT